jgi:hypothetical protein
MHQKMCILVLLGTVPSGSARTAPETQLRSMFVVRTFFVALRQRTFDFLPIKTPYVEPGNLCSLILQQLSFRKPVRMPPQLAKVVKRLRVGCDDDARAFGIVFQKRLFPGHPGFKHNNWQGVTLFGFWKPPGWSSVGHNTFLEQTQVG